MALPEITDYYSDKSKQLFYKINKTYDTPEFVKLAREETTDDLVGLPTDCFADIARHKLPCHTKCATWLAAAYYIENYDTYSPRESKLVACNLVKKAKLFKIEAEVATLMTKEAGRRSVQEDPQYALVVTTRGETVGMFPTNTREATVKSAATLVHNRQRYSLEMRKSAARKLINAVNKHGARLLPSVGDQLNKSAGFGIGLGSNISEAIGKRIYMVKNAKNNEGCQDLANIASMLRQQHMALPMLEKVATAIEAFDVQNNLTRYYGEIPSPEEICFDMSVEKLSALKDDHVELITGDIVSLNKIASLSQDDFRDVMGDTLTDAITDTANGSYDRAEMMEVLPSLPRDMASTLATFIEDN